MHGYAELHERDALDPDRRADAGRPSTLARRRRGRRPRRIELRRPTRERPRRRRAARRPRARRDAPPIASQAGGERREGVVRTQPYWTKPGDAAELTIAIGSCFFLADPDPALARQDYGGGYGIFDAIAAKKPDLMLWLGDNLYLQRRTSSTRPSMAARYRRQRAFEPLQGLLDGDDASRDLGRPRLRPERHRRVVRAEGRNAEALPALLAQSELRPARRAGRVRRRALRRRRCSSCSTTATTARPNR